MSAMLIIQDWKAWFEIFFLFSVLIGLSLPLGSYIAKVYQGEPVFLDKILSPLERLIYKFSWIDSQEQMSWREYAQSVISLGIMSFLLLYFLLRIQYYLPLNPQNYLGIKPDLAFNIAISFVTDTAWQSYEGEKVLSYFSQMVGLTVQNFLSASMLMAVAIVLVRGIVRTTSKFLGNFWVDLTRGILYILLPISIILAILLGSQGVIQNFNAYLILPSIESEGLEQQIEGGPVASLVAIKQLVSGGGFFGANSAHPFENPTPFSNFLEILSILLMPVSLIVAYGYMIKDKKQSKALLILMLSILIFGFLFCTYQEIYPAYDESTNYEGKEYRHGILNSILWTVSTTATSNGSTNSLIEFYHPLAGMVPLIFQLTGEIILGGIGQGLYSLLLYIFITMFIAGLMSGRMPEYLGKKIEVFEIKMTILAILTPGLILFILFAMCVKNPEVVKFFSSESSKGFTALLYVLTSITANNGSNFLASSFKTPFFYTIFGIGMLLSRYMVALLVLAIAGNLVVKVKTIKKNNHTTSLPASFVFMALMVGVMIFALCDFMPLVFMGPISDHFSGVG